MSTKGTNTDVAKRELTDGDLRSLNSIADVQALFGTVESVSDIAGTGFDVLPTNEKARLVGVNFVIVTWRFSKGDNGDFVSALVITETGDKYVVNDGSTGIMAQLREFGEPRPLAVKGGLRRSDYQYADQKTGEMKNATTYYINT